MTDLESHPSGWFFFALHAFLFDHITYKDIGIFLAHTTHKKNYFYKSLTNVKTSEEAF